MEATLSHQKDPAMDWNITASAKADKNEKIVRAQIIVNDSSEYDESFDPPMSSWHKQLTQKGNYPGDNTVKLIITNDQGEDTGAEDEWS